MAFGPPSIPGLGTGAGFTMQLQDRSGGSPDYLAEQTQRFMEAARKRPEIGRINTLYRAAVPQVYADIDRSKVLKSGVQLNDVNTTLGALLGSSYVNDFNRFGRVYKVYVQAEPEFRQRSETARPLLREEPGGRHGAARHAGHHAARLPDPSSRTASTCSDPAELTGVPAAGFSSTQALDALEATAREVLPPDMSFDWADMSYQERKAPGVADGVRCSAIFLVFLILAAQYESWGLPFSVLLGTPFAAFGAYLGLWLARAVPRAELREQRVRADRPDHAHRPGREERDSDRRVREDGGRPGKPLIEAALNAAKLRFRPILHDGVRLHPRRRAAADRDRAPAPSRAR